MKFLFASIAMLQGCTTDPLTEIIVVVDSDLEVPTEIDSVRIEVRGAGMDRGSTGSLSGQNALPLPRTLDLIHGSGPLGPIDVRAVGLRAGGEVLERQARVSFIAGATVMLRLNLLSQCVRATCEPGQTCGDGSMRCRPVEIGPEELPVWNGVIPPLFGDAGASDAGDGDDVGADGCSISPEQCNGLDDDCDGMTDEATDTIPCTIEHGSGTCVMGGCQVEQCDAGFGDCDGTVINGCESEVRTATYCGDCATTCVAPTGMCLDGSCASGCRAPTPTPCGTSCVDTGSDLSHCGSCGMSCPVPSNGSATCSAGRCGIRCNSGFGDCNGLNSDGCEVPLNTVGNCGGCGVGCMLSNATESCSSGSCAIGTCNVGFGDCDGADSNGCERDLMTDSSHCMTCGMACGSMQSCQAGMCVMSGPCFLDDFSDGVVTGWTQSGSALVESGGTFHTTSGSTGVSFVTAGTGWPDYTVSADIWPIDNDIAGITFRVQDASRYYVFRQGFGDNDNWALRLWSVQPSGTSELYLDPDNSGPAVGEVENVDRSYNFRVEVSGTTLRGYIDGALKFDVSDGTFPRGSVGTYLSSMSGTRFDNFRVDCR